MTATLRPMVAKEKSRVSGCYAPTFEFKVWGSCDRDATNWRLFCGVKGRRAIKLGYGYRVNEAFIRFIMNVQVVQFTSNAKCQSTSNSIYLLLLNPAILQYQAQFRWTPIDIHRKTVISFVYKLAPQCTRLGSTSQSQTYAPHLARPQWSCVTVTCNSKQQHSRKMRLRKSAKKKRYCIHAHVEPYVNAQGFPKLCP